ncbi:DinB family protein [Kribbella sp. NBC_01505]|uniref:DinB family protein n=1 Tax=Kribbella sp. NBC_01505 TaxID=2903580 RepID=UPI0038703183
MDQPPPGTDADEKTTLIAFLDYLRNSVIAKTAGAPEPAVRTAGVSSGTSVLGLLKHLAYVERFYFQGEPVRSWAATMRPGPTDTIESLTDTYRDAIANSNKVIAAYSDLSRPAPLLSRRKSQSSMRWLLIHMIEETGRHAGHADILREQIDDITGR